MDTTCVASVARGCCARGRIPILFWRTCPAPNPLWRCALLRARYTRRAARREIRRDSLWPRSTHHPALLPISLSGLVRLRVSSWAISAIPSCCFIRHSNFEFRHSHSHYQLATRVILALPWGSSGEIRGRFGRRFGGALGALFSTPSNKQIAITPYQGDLYA